MRKIVSIFLVLMICGCTGMPNLGNLFGTQKTKVKELPPDVIVIQDINILPKPPINAGDQFSISFNVNNQEEKRNVDYVGYKLLDEGLCTLISGNEDRGSFTTEGSPFVPKQTEFVEWTFKAPNAGDLAYINSKCPVRFNVSYTFDAISEIEADVISVDKYNQLQQSGQFQTFVPTLSLGRGPIKILMEFGAALPMKAGGILPVYITVEDKGTGLYTSISNETDKRLTIKILSGFGSADCGGRFKCDNATGVECYNIQTIPMIERKSPTFRCSLTQTGSVPIEKVYVIDASLNYNYDITNQVDVDIKVPS